MLKKENRLSKPSVGFKKRINSPLFSIGITANNLDVSRFAFIVSKKVDSRAVVRNRTKRKIRALVERALSELPKGKDFAFYVKKEAVDAKQEEVGTEINRIFKKI